MKLDRGQVLGLLFVAASLALTAAVYPRLPDPMPTHWSSEMEPDGFTPKPLGAFLPAGILGGVWLLFVVLPRISPRGFRFESFSRAWRVLQPTLMGFFFLVTSLILATAAGARVPLERALGASMGVMLIVLGNFMGKLTKNFFIGIRTPWTIASDEVWLRTHRLGGKLFVLAGVALFAAAAAGVGMVVAIGAVVVAALISAVYSYVLYRRLEGFREAPAGEGPPR
ncbi:MAG: SdpI family protein [Acidobacteriota bacterium]|nr:SdpI family protein [Acidobacteriota bacterium]